MDNVRFIEIETPNGSIYQHAIIEHADGSCTAMLKSTYDEQQAASEAKVI